MHYSALKKNWVPKNSVPVPLGPSEWGWSAVCACEQYSKPGPLNGGRNHHIYSRNLTFLKHFIFGTPHTTCLGAG